MRVCSKLACKESWIMQMFCLFFQCDDFIEKYGAGIIILLESVADPKVICQVKAAVCLFLPWLCTNQTLHHRAISRCNNFNK